jgi:hypothetical protein
VAPVLHKVFVALLVSVTAVPEHTVVLPPGVMVGTAGIALTVTITGVLTVDEQLPLIVCTV